VHRSRRPKIRQAPASALTERPPRSRATARAALNRSMLALIAGIGWTKARLLRRQGFVSRWTQTPHGRLHLLEAANHAAQRSGGATWVFIHGFGGQATDWSTLLRQMRPFCRRLLALDLPGHGRSRDASGDLSAERVTQGALEAIDSLLEPDETMVVVGSSMGGLGAVRCVQRFKKRVLGLVLVSPAGAPMTPTELDGLMELFDVHDMDGALRFVDRLYVNGVPGRRLTAMGVLAHLNRASLRRLLADYRAYPFLSQAELAELPPSLLVWGEKDDFLPKTSRDFYRRGLRQATVQMPKDFGHTPFIDRGKELSELMLAWAQGRGLLC
jgi:pimeloyl-ACP methyl ester carboxylesterase